MKFEKFVKSLAGAGVIYSHDDKQYLAGEKVLMAIPEGFHGVVAKNIVEMPEGIARLIDMAWKTVPCTLTRAELPTGDAKIRDAIRIFATERGLEITIDNASYSLLNSCDTLDIYPSYESEAQGDVAKALFVYKPRQDENDETEIVGLIFPTLK